MVANDQDRKPVRPLTERIAPLLKAFMRTHRITQVDLAQELGRDQSYVSERVTGKRAFTTDDIDALAALAAISPQELIEHLADALEERDDLASRRARKVAPGVRGATQTERAVAKKKSRDRGEQPDAP